MRLGSSPSSNGSTKTMAQVATGALSLVVVIFFLFSQASTASAASTDAKKYILLIDAGSSGSRLHVHGYTSGSGPLPIVDASQNLKQKPGLSSYAKNPHQGGDSMDELYAFAKEKVPEELWASTPVYLQATAGLRSIPEQEAEAILEAVRDKLQTWVFKFDRSWAKIISGRDEGVNGFIASNYLKGVFNKPEFKQEDTFGVVEMGGASFQISFCPDNVDQMPQAQKDQLVPVQLGETTLMLYTHSYLGYGLEKAAEIMSAEEVSRIEDDGNPCVLKNSRHSGAGELSGCETLINHALFFDGTKKAECDSCSFSGIFQPPVAGETFLAIENFFYTTQFFGIDKEANFFELLQSKGTEWCSADYTEVQKEHADLKVGDINKYCFSSGYIHQILANLGFTAEQLQTNVHIAREIDGVGIDWALGAVIAAITSDNHSAGESSGWSATQYLALFVLAGVVGFLVVRFLKWRKANARTEFPRYAPV